MYFSKMKIFILIVLAFAMLFFYGCSSENQNNSDFVDSSKLQIYTTIFPLYDFTRQIGGENVQVHSLIPIGVEPHEFEPSLQDIQNVHASDLFIYNGGGYESWVKKITENLETTTMVLDASHDIEFLKGKDGLNHDPHVWLDPLRARQQAKNIVDALVQLDPAHQGDYQENYEQLMTQLEKLDTEYEAALLKAKKQEVVVSHQAFGYLASRYGFKQIPISGLSPSDEPSQKELQQLIHLVEEHQLKYIAFDSFMESKVAKTIQRETHTKTVTLYTIENVTKEQLAAGTTYMDLMKKNLESLKKVLEVE